MAKCHNMVASGLLPPAPILPKKDWNGWDPSAATRGEAYASSSQWNLASSSSSSSSSSSGDVESFLEKQSPDYHSNDPWQAGEPMQRDCYSSMMMIGGEVAPPQGTMLPTQVLNFPYSSTSFALPAQFFSPPRMEVDSSSSYETAPTFEACIPLKPSSPTSFNNTDATTSFDPCGPYGPAFDSSDSSEASSYGSTPPFESYYPPYDSHPFISSPSHDSSDQEFAASPGILHHADEHTDPSAPFLYTQDDGTLACSPNTQLDYLSRCQGEPDHYSIGNGPYKTYGQSHTPPPQVKMPVEPATKTKKVLKKPYACFPCDKGFERHEHLTRHKLTMTHRKTLKDRGIPCYDPPPQMTACPFCPRKFNRSDNLKPHMLTHMHLAGENKRNTPISIEDSVRSGQAKIDPRLKQMLDAKKNVAQVRLLLNYGAERNG